MLAGKLSGPAENPCDAGDSGAFLCKETIFYLFVVSSEREGYVSAEDDISGPGITKGEHWHHSKWEFFIVVAGHGLIQQRKIGLDENGEPYPVLNFEVSGEKIEAVHMLPGYTHNIINLSDSENLVTLMWANELFDPDHPDTFFEKVEESQNGK